MTTNRRRFLQSATMGAAAFSVPGVFAETLRQTAVMGDGPFYPDRMPLDTDNDLLIINDLTTPAIGEIAHLTGRLLSEAGEPIRNAVIEIWQSDVNGSYIHTEGRHEGRLDGNFQGYGRFLTDSAGRYYFRTIKPVPYTLLGTFRAPHIHVAVSKAGQRLMATQALVKGHEANARDEIIARVRDPAALETLMVEYRPLPDSKLGELAANFDIVLGRTAEELEDGSIGGIGAPEPFRG
jgi:protocatechuate 3,4-dioxygenase, beta subunit